MNDPRAADAPGEWLSVHIFYAANPQPLLTRCIRPLLDELRGDGLLAGHFFLHYWLEGPHVRLRLRPSSAAVSVRVRRRTEAAIAGYLAARPALYQVDPAQFGEFYDSLLALEFPVSDRADLTDADGRMKVRPNNSYRFEHYEPELGKYGGIDGVALAEWHFQVSSELVLDASASLNLHLRTVRLGTAAQLMMVMTSCFLSETDQLGDYLDLYYRFCEKSFSGRDFLDPETYRQRARSARAGLGERFVEIRSAVARNETARLPGHLASWAAHCLELRDRAHRLASSGALTFSLWDGSGEQQITDPATAFTTLLSPYLHMTNNRLHLTFRDEAYLAFLLRSAVAGAAEEVGVG